MGVWGGNGWWVGEWWVGGEVGSWHWWGGGRQGLIVGWVLDVSWWMGLIYLEPMVIMLFVWSVGGPRVGLKVVGEGRCGCSLEMGYGDRARCWRAQPPT